MDEAVYHLVTPDAWGADPGADYAPASLATEGFIHCAFGRQVARSANKFYAGAPALLAVRLDPARLTSPLAVEPPSPASTSPERYPHVYGPIQRAAVAEVVALSRDAGG